MYINFQKNNEQIRKENNFLNSSKENETKIIFENLNSEKNSSILNLKINATFRKSENDELLHNLPPLKKSKADKNSIYKKMVKLAQISPENRFFNQKIKGETEKSFDIKNQIESIKFLANKHEQYYYLSKIENKIQPEIIEINQITLANYTDGICGTSPKKPFQNIKVNQLTQEYKIDSTHSAFNPSFSVQSQIISPKPEQNKSVPFWPNKSTLNYSNQNVQNSNNKTQNNNIFPPETRLLQSKEKISINKTGQFSKLNKDSIRFFINHQLYSLIIISENQFPFFLQFLFYLVGFLSFSFIVVFAFIFFKKKKLKII